MLGAAAGLRDRPGLARKSSPDGFWRRTARLAVSAQRIRPAHDHLVVARIHIAIEVGRLEHPLEQLAAGHLLDQRGQRTGVAIARAARRSAAPWRRGTRAPRPPRSAPGSGCALPGAWPGTRRCAGSGGGSAPGGAADHDRAHVHHLEVLVHDRHVVDHLVPALTSTYVRGSAL